MALEHLSTAICSAIWCEPCEEFTWGEAHAPPAACWRCGKPPEEKKMKTRLAGEVLGTPVYMNQVDAKNTKK